MGEGGGGGGGEGGCALAKGGSEGRGGETTYFGDIRQVMR